MATLEGDFNAGTVKGNLYEQHSVACQGFLGPHSAVKTASSKFSP